jgi:hypothetical protein
VKRIKIILIICSFISLKTVCAQEFNWGYQEELMYRQNREDSTTWDYKNFQIDLESSRKKSNPGVFPSPNYNLIGKDSFKGLGYGGSFSGLVVNNKRFVWLYFYVNKSVVNEQYIDEHDYDNFFVLVVSTSFIDTVGFKHISANIVSRNHPHYLAQGYVVVNPSMDFVINYSAFIAGNRDTYAIINSRLFNLKVGKLLFLVPQKDGSIRSVQEHIPALSKEQLEGYIQTFLKVESNVSLYLKATSL